MTANFPMTNLIPPPELEIGQNRTGKDNNKNGHGQRISKVKNPACQNLFGLRF